MAVERRGVGVGAFALLMLWVSLIWPALGKLACEESGYCSLGKTKQFVGDISQPGNLRKLLESTAYKQEIILIQMSGSKVYIEMMLQLRADFKELGMSHVVVLSSKEDICRAFLSFDADMSCVWDGSLLHDASFAPYERTIHGRLRFMARTGRMGYNVMSFDSDFHIYRDPYPYLKGYPMQNKTLVTTLEHGCGINAGFMYMQNAKPDGPATWIFRFSAELPLRWMDDNFTLTSSFGQAVDHMCMSFEQAFLDAALQSTMAQRPIYAQILDKCIPGGREGDKAKLEQQQQAWRQASGSTLSKFDAIDKQYQLAWSKCHKGMEMLDAPPPGSWPSMEMHPDHTEMRNFNLTAPAWFVGMDDPDFGGRYFSNKGGQYSGAFIAQMKDDCPDCPWWPDEDQAAASKITEAFAFVPRWFVSSAWLLNTGYLTPLDGGEARQVAVHAHAVPGTFGSQHMKIGVRRPYNRYHFELSRELHSHPNGPTYLKSTGPYLVGLEAPKRLLMLHPDVDLSWVANPEEYRIITLGLMQLAMLSSRAVVFPDLPCNTSMVFDHGNESRGCDGNSYLPLRRREYMPWAALVDTAGAPTGPRALRLTNPYLWLDACVNTLGLTGLLHLEFERYWLKYDRPDGAKVEPITQNTAFIPKDPNLAKHPKDPNLDSDSPEWSLGEVIVSLSPQEAFNELAKYDKEAIVYVKHPVTVRAVSHNSTQPQEPVEASKEYPDVVVPTNWTGRFEDITSTCSGIFKNPFAPWFSDSLAVPEDARGVPGFMKDGRLFMEEGATYPGNAKKPWTEKDGPLFG